MSEFDKEFGVLIGTVRKLEEHHNDYQKDIEKNDMLRDQIKDMMGDLTGKFQEFSVTLNELKKSIVHLEGKVQEIKNKIILAGWAIRILGVILGGIGAFVYGFWEYFRQLFIYILFSNQPLNR